MALQNKLAEFFLRASTHSGDGVVIAPYADDFIFQGRAFTTNDIYNVPTGTDLLILLDPTAIDYAIGLPFFLAAEDGPFVVTLYVGTDYTGGTSANIFNRDATSATTEDALITYSSTGGVSGTTTGVQVTKYLVGTSGGPVTSGGGQVAKNLPFVINTSVKYLLAIDNQSASNPAMFEFGFTWYE